ncbi:hypothetical protein ONE63_006822 [Megalurothrips usitatus]|uniref:Major facilitator superfamily (MFS) profile domain-containing protein n=1 Tax=Megalurothrips usitatus TaxID=439358 RepID=A0AAV7XR61_9NEOP|nr:hypothetical protein ONE63_006822 [Megalurothrips usitatus]
MYIKRLCKVWQYGMGRTVLATLAAHSNSISVGLCQGYSAILLPQLQDKDSKLDISEQDASWIAALGVISNPLGALLSGLLVELLGRRGAIQLTAIPYVVGWVCLALSKQFTLICVGRFISGLAVGMASASYVYVAEVAPASHRGPLSACGPVLVSLGVLVVYTLGFFAAWHIVAALCTIFALFSLVAISLVPETPPWLASRGREAEARTALVWLRRSPAAADKELDEIKESLAHAEKEREAGAGRCSFVNPAIWKPFVLLLAFFFFQEGSGIYVVLYYAVSLFQEVGTGMNEYVASIWVACMRLAMSVLGALAIQRLNRTTLACLSGVGMFLAMLVAGFYEHLFSSVAPASRPLPWVPLACFLVHVCVSMLGYLQLPWIMTGELFPLRARGAMGGFVSSLAHLLIFTSVKTYPDLRNAIGMDGVLWVFSGLSLCGALFGKLLLPETNGKTLREIEMSFADGPDRDKGRDEEAPAAPQTLAPPPPGPGGRKNSRGEVVAVPVDTNDDSILDIVLARDTVSLGRQR